MGNQFLQCYQMTLIRHKERCYRVVFVLIYATCRYIVTVDIDPLQSVGTMRGMTYDSLLS